MLIKSATIDIQPSHEDLLHKDLGVPECEKIPLSEMQAKLSTASPEEKRRLIFALNTRKWHHSK